MKSGVLLISFVSLLLFCFLTPFGHQKIEWQGSIEQEDGVTVIKNPEEPLFGKIELELEEDLVIGHEEDENFRFYKWISLDVDADGNIHVMDRGSFRIQIFDRNGAYIRTIGREGEGPGEFSQPTFLRLDDAGNTYVEDRTKAHIFDKDGTYVRAFPKPMSSRSFKITQKGELLGEDRTIRPPKDLYECVVLMNDQNKVLKKMAEFYSPKMDSMFNRKDRFAIHVPELCFCPAVQDYAVYGFPEEYRLFVADSDGNITKIIEKDEPAEKITNRERDKIIDVLMGNIKSRPSSTQLAREELEKRVLISKFRPFFEELRIDEHGNIYAQRLNSYLSEDKRYEFDVFNAEGRHTYRLRVPAGVINLRIIKGGYVFSAPYNQEIGYFQVKRYKIKNLDPLSVNK